MCGKIKLGELLNVDDIIVLEEVSIENAASLIIYVLINKASDIVVEKANDLKIVHEEVSFRNQTKSISYAMQVLERQLKIDVHL